MLTVQDGGVRSALGIVCSSHCAPPERVADFRESLQKGFEDSPTGTLSYNKMTQKKSRRTAAACLFELLVLKTKDYVHIDQDAPFGDVTITAAAQME